jgi:uncharacterized membrane protein YhaH (DUF805 family)
MKLLRLWFSLHAPVSRRAYAASGFVLMGFKYAVEALVIHGVTGKWLLPTDYLNPLLTARQSVLSSADWLLVPLVLWTLPFLWIGVSMTLRRLVDAGATPYVAFLYFVPAFNNVLMLTLCFLGSAPVAAPTSAPVVDRTAQLRSALLRTAIGVGTALAMVGISVALFGVYGTTLFFTTPVVVGAASALVFNHGHLRSWNATFLVALMAISMAGGAILLFALEGILCLGMAAPIAIGMALMGAAVGRLLAEYRGVRLAQVGMVLAALPFLTATDVVRVPRAPTEVLTTIEVDAPPERVWPHVIGFAELPPPRGGPFGLGVAHPRRARIVGRGVGAVRYCEFSTGPFVEPITAWEEPYRLAFDVAAQPRPMEEWSPWAGVDPPHLHGYLRARRGEFRLHRLPGGRTRVEGRTWYELDMAPEAYWSVWTDALLHAIHRRVLAHVKHLAEQAG